MLSGAGMQKLWYQRRCNKKSDEKFEKAKPRYEVRNKKKVWGRGPSILFHIVFR